jgi:alpha-tubulin suppressor-like RCC1 family protein
MTGLSEVSGLTVGAEHFCALKRSGRVACWGEGAEFRLGHGTEVPSFGKPVEVLELTDAVQVSVRKEGTCALRASGQLICWGNWRWLPGEEKGVDDGGRLSPHGARCVVRRSGEVACWEAEAKGQPALVPVRGLTDGVDVVTGESHACALRASGRVACWGDNARGQLGDGGGPRREDPGEVVGLEDVVQLAASGDHTCAVRRSGHVACWGRNDHGQLGDGTTTDRSTPVEVSAVEGAVQVAAGSGHGCALLAPGARVVCWGDNASGQLGIGKTKDRPTLVPVTFPSERPPGG